MSLGMFMAVLDVQIVATALPEIGSALGIAPDAMSWIQTAYLIAEVIGIALTGRLTEALGLKGLFVGGVCLFTAASLACAAAPDFAVLVAFRVVQGAAAGVLVPSVFTAVFRLFPGPGQALATTVAGCLAVLAPTVGPLAGGWLTDTWSWHWLFLINLGPGLMVVALTTWLLPPDTVHLARLRHLDLLGLALMAGALACLVIGLKEAPRQGWLSWAVIGLLLGSAVLSALLVLRCLRHPAPVLRLGSFSDRNFALGCGLSFILGVGLFAIVYVMPVFLAFVRGHRALAIGELLLVTGIAQLAAGPVVIALDRRMSARWLTGIGFLLFAVGLGWSAFQTPRTDGLELVGPQILRGIGIMACLVPPTRLALDAIAPERLADASGLFNLMRNLGGAVGLALVDTVIYGRVAGHGQDLVSALAGGSSRAAAFVGLPGDRFHGVPLQAQEAPILFLIRPMIEDAALTRAIDDSLAMLAALMLLALALLPHIRKGTGSQ